jgi:hypothetical protein
VKPPWVYRALTAAGVVGLAAACWLFVGGRMLPTASLADIRAVQRMALVAFIATGCLVLIALARIGARDASRASALLAVAWLLAGVAFYVPFSNDDAFIFSRFARNLALGHGLVFNPGERVEGFTSLGWVLTLAAATRLGLDTVIAAKVLGVLLAASSTVLIHASVRNLTRDGVASLAAAAAFASSQLLASWAGSGMDVAIFIAWEMALVYAALSRRRADGLVVGLCAVGFLVRPEAYFVVAVIAGWLLWREFECSPRRAVATLGGLVLLAGLPFVARWEYFGRLLPNTFYAKSSLFMHSGFGYWLGGMEYLGWPLVAAALAGLVLLWRRDGWLLGCCAVYVAYFWYVGRDVLSFRMVLFTVPFLMIGVGRLVAAAKDMRLRKVVAITICGVLLIRAAWQMSEAPGRLHDQRGHLYVPSNSVGTFQADYLAGVYLARHAQSDDWLATENVGAVGYYGGTRVFDSYGLVSREVAESIHRAGPRLMVHQLLRLKPAWILCYLEYDRLGGEHWVSIQFGDIHDWGSAQYAPVGPWQSVTGYDRVLLRRR